MAGGQSTSTMSYVPMTTAISGFHPFIVKVISDATKICVAHVKYVLRITGSTHTGHRTINFSA